MQAFQPKSHLRSVEKKSSDEQKTQQFYTNLGKNLPKVKLTEFNPVKETNRAQSYVKSLLQVIEVESDYSEAELMQSLQNLFKDKLSDSHANVLIKPAQKRYLAEKNKAQIELKALENEFHKELSFTSWDSFFGKFKTYADFRKIADLYIQCTTALQGSRSYLFREVMSQSLFTVPLLEEPKCCLFQNLTCAQSYDCVKFLTQFGIFLLGESDFLELNPKDSRAFVENFVHEYLWGRDPDSKNVWVPNMYWTQGFQEFLISVKVARKKKTQEESVSVYSQTITDAMMYVEKKEGLSLIN
jgi:hypothetical protein